MDHRIKSGFSLYTNSREAMQNSIRKKQIRKKQRWIFLGIFCAVLLAIFLAYRYRTYHSLKTEKVIAEHVDSTTKFFAYKSGSISYNEDGISFIDGDGKTVWEKAYSIKNPIVTYCGDYIVVAYKNGNEILLYDSSGKVKRFSTSYAISDVEVAEQGVIAAILQGDDENYIELYDASQKKLVTIKTTVDENGYPLDIDLSDDGTMLAVSYLVVDGLQTKNRVAFYDFGEKGQEKEDRLLAGFDFKDTVIPKLQFMGQNTVCAIGDNKTIIFNTKDTPSKQKEIKIDSRIKSVAADDSHFALVLENKKKSSKEQYLVQAYNRSGKMVMEKEIKTEFSDVYLGDDGVLFVGNYHCSMINFAGHEMYQQNFKKRIQSMAPTGKAERYLITFEDKTQLVRLR